MIDFAAATFCRRRRSVPAALVFASIAFLTAVSPSSARAQATYTADRVNGFSVFGMVSRLNTDYGQTDDGYTVGADLTHAIKFRWITPSIEMRYTGSTGPAITEDSFTGGLKIEHAFHRFHPYGNVMIGYGVINYVQVGQNDNSIIYGLGGGLDFNVTHQFAVKVDAHEQFWKLGQATSELTPQSLSVGVLYRLPASFGRSKSK
jgi:hypothetical protein